MVRHSKEYFAKYRVYSIWTAVNANSELFTNELYTPSDSPASLLAPSTLSKNIKCVCHAHDGLTHTHTSSNKLLVASIQGCGRATSAAGTRRWSRPCPPSSTTERPRSPSSRMPIASLHVRPLYSIVGVNGYHSRVQRLESEQYRKGADRNGSRKDRWSHATSSILLQRPFHRLTARNISVERSPASSSSKRAQCDGPA